MMPIGFQNSNLPQANLLTIDAASQVHSFTNEASFAVIVHPKPIGYIIGEQIALPILKSVGELWAYLNQTKPAPGPVNGPTPGPVTKA